VNAVTHVLCLQNASALTTAVRNALARGPRRCAPAAVGDRAPFPTAVGDALARGANGAFTAALLVAAFAAPVRKALAGRAQRALGAARVVTPLACAPPFAPREQQMADGGGEGVASRREKDVSVASLLD